MPPKKKNGKGKGKGKGKKEKNSEGIEGPGGEIINENSKQFFLYQIKDLEDKLARYQKKCDEMEVMCKKYEVQYESSNLEKRDIVSTLKKECDKKSDEILDLNDRLIGLQQSKEAEKELCEKQLADLRTESQEAKDVLTNQNNSLLAKLTALEEFESQKEKLSTDLSDLKEQLENLKTDHKAEKAEIEKKVIIDKDRLKKEMVVKVSQVAAEFRRVSNKQMADTTKRTIKENVSINNQIQKMSEKIIDLIDDNDNSKIKDKVKKQQIDLLEDNEKELARKNISNLKVIRLLTEKCRQQETIILELEDKLVESKNLEISQENTINELEEKLENYQDSSLENANLKTLIKELQEEHLKASKYRTKIENVLKKATDSIIIALSKNAVTQKRYAEKLDDGFEWNSVEKRDNMLEHMLVLLNSAAAVGMGPNPKIFSSDYLSRPRTSEFPGSGKGLRKNQVPDPNGHDKLFQAHYALGDLGIVPRASAHIPNNLEKMTVLYPKKELASLKKVTKKTISTQTIDFTKSSVFGADIELVNREKTHPIYENIQKRMGQNSQIIMPINDHNRPFKVTDKVF